MMFCPYIRNTYIRAIAIGYNDEMIENGSVLIEKYINEECKREKCGAWYEGRCRFNG